MCHPATSTNSCTCEVEVSTAEVWAVSICGASRLDSGLWTPRFGDQRVGLGGDRDWRWELETLSLGGVHLIPVP